ncbi:hypothetical protein DESC_640005 [Desulfosarcina cetonica]|nr:hypothetical protein DESC_640005 [Desulfosarcina cetonica]
MYLVIFEKNKGKSYWISYEQ